jgi:hypothetical protein
MAAARGYRSVGIALLAVWVALVAVLVGSSLPSVEQPLREPIAEAPNEATAMAAAHRQGSPVEVVSQRTPTRAVYANPSGTLTAELSVVPTRVRQRRGWVPVETSVVSRADGALSPRAVVGELALSGGGSTAPLARMERDGKWLAVFWPGALPMPKVDGATVTYPGVLPGVDLVMRAEPNGYRQHLVVRTAEAARHPGLARIALRIETAGLRVSADNAGVVRAVDDTGEPVFVAPPSVMWDSSGTGEQATARSAPVRVTVRDGSLVLQPDLAFLADPTVVFPVTIDPDMRTWDKSNWASTVSGLPNTAFWWRSAAPNGDAVAQVGQCYNGDGECGSPSIGAVRAYFQYDTNFLAGRRILGAELKSVVTHSPNCTAYPHQIWRTDGQIDPGTTWNNAPQGSTVTDYLAAGVHDNCPGQKAAGAGTINTAGVTTYFFNATNESLQLAWRKLDPAQTKLSVTFNTGPHQPTALGTNPPLPMPCRWCNGTPYLGDEFIRLHATLSDPDNDFVKPKWIIYTNEVPEERWGVLQASGATHDTTVDLRNRHDQRVRWQAQTWDTLNGNNLDGSVWAFSGAFAVDRIPPQRGPDVSAVLYADDNRWHGGVGVPGTFTFTPVLAAGESNDIDHYLWGWQDPPTNKVDAATRLGDSATVELTPPGDGPRDLFVQSVDRAGHRSPTAVHHFYVRPGNGPLAHWALDGNAADTAYLGDRHGTVTGPATWGPGAVDTAIQITQDASTTADPVVRTDTSFSVSAWVRLTEGSVPRVAVSQVDSRVAGFELGYRPETGGRWAFLMPRTNSDNPVIDMAASAQPAQLGAWTHLAGVYHAASNEMRLYVNGVLVGTAAHTSRWHARSDTRIGATRWNGSRNAYWRGAIDEVQMYDRVVAESELAAIVSRDNAPASSWRFEDESTVGGRPNTIARNSVDGGSAATLTNGAAFTAGGAVKGAVRFDGVDDAVLTDGPSVRTDQSFSVAAWVKADRLVTGTHMTAVSQLGAFNSGFALQYNSGHQKWLFLFASADGEPATWGGAASSQQPVTGQWVHLAGVYDAAARQLRIYVNGQLGGSQPWTSTWHATGPVAIGRGMWRGQPSEHWPGSIDEVRLYTRALSEADVRAIVSQDNVSVGHWQLDGNAADSSGRGLHGTLTGSPTFTTGQSNMPNPADQAVRLNGGSSYVSAPNAVDPTKSFSVAAWARLDQLRTGSAVVSQDAGRISVFNLHNAGDGRWVFAMRSCDASWRCVETRAVGTEAQAGVWVHLAGTYDAVRGQLAIFVNGVLAGSKTHTQTWNVQPGSLLIGRATWGNTEPADFFPGAIDDVTIYNRPLFAEEIRALAGRDLSLVHNWRLDEATGPAADAVGARSATLTGGATFAPGRVGNSIRLDGVDDAATTTGVDLRTDQSFTVSAWVRLNGNDCDLTVATRCVVDAVSVDGTQTSKFHLGHVVDSDQAPHGKWVFEMPEPDTNGTVTEAALSVEPGEIVTWVHLVGVYDAPTKKIWLYVNGNRVDDGTLNTPWHASGGLQIGRGQAASQAAWFWPGSVDDVRVYTGPLDKNRISALFRSYPASA